MAYDSARAEVVLFGGWTDGGDLAGTWTWDGSSWSQHDVAGPGPRSSAAMSWDPWTRRVILHGGCGDGDPADTWAWDGERWERLDGGAAGRTGPGNRCRATLAPLAKLEGLVLFGGLSGRGPGAIRHRDVWLWRRATWTRLGVDDDLPEGRANHAMVRDPVRDELILYGGAAADRRVRTDVWRFDGRSWKRDGTISPEDSKRLPGSTPVAREVPAMAWHEAIGRFVLHGGRGPDGESLGDTWTFGDDGWEAAADAQLETPGERGAHGMVYHDGLACVVLIGGAGGGRGGVWAWDGESWRHSESEGGSGHSDDPTLRGHFALAYDRAAERMLLHGGLRLGEDGGDRFGDLWSWSDGAWTRLHGPETGPGVRDHHAMAWDHERGQLLLFGGGRGVPGDQTLLADTWIYREGEWRQVPGAMPPARATHRLAYDERRGRIVLFGGWGEAGLLNDTWEWDGRRWEQVATDGPPPRFATRLAYDAAIGRVVLYGGRGSNGDLGDTWEWDGAEWTLIDPDGDPDRPGPRNVHGLAYDAGRGRLVLYGGIAGGARRSDTWERNGRRWMPVP